MQIEGGTGYNIEMMSSHLSILDFFEAIYLVDMSPSLCEVARKRFTQLGWKNMKLICKGCVVLLWPVAPYGGLFDIRCNRAEALTSPASCRLTYESK